MMRVIQGGKDAFKGVGLADYIWLDAAGMLHVKKFSVYVMESLESGTPVPIPILEAKTVSLGLVSFVLSPCHYLADPLRGENHFVVLCEPRLETGTATSFNTRAVLRNQMEKHGDPLGTWWGYRQGYRFTAPTVTGELFLAAERHLCCCMDAGIPLYSGQVDDPNGNWNFKIGPRNFPHSIDVDPPSAAVMPDFLIFSRYFLEKIAREQGYAVEFSSCSVFLSTEETRDGKLRTSEMASVLSSQVGQWEPQIHLGLEGQAVLQPQPTRTPYLEDKGLPPNADPYVVTATVLEALRS